MTDQYVPKDGDILHVRHNHGAREVHIADYSNEPRVTRYIARPGNAVWVRVGIGWCAGYLIRIVRRKGQHRPVIKFVTGAKEVRDWSELRFRKGESR